MPPYAGLGELLGKPHLAKRYDRTPRTIDRWQADAKVGFPRADIVINNREFWRPPTIEAWESSKAEDGSVIPIAGSDAPDR